MKNTNTIAITDPGLRDAALAELCGEILPAPPPLSPTGRDPSGRFLPGHGMPGPGRPRGQGLDIRALAERESETAGVNLEHAMWLVVKKLIELAQAGDVAAAKLLIDKLGIVDPIDVRVAASLEALIVASNHP